MSEPEIIYQDENFLAVNKPAGLLVHKARITNYQLPITNEPTLVDWLLKKYPEIKNVGDDPETRPGIVHRLDKDTSGVMLVAKNQKYFEYLKSLFQRHEVKKTYLAVVAGELRPRAGVISKPIGIKSGTTKHSVHSKKFLKDAVTEYGVVKSLKLDSGRGEERGFSLVEVWPKTGRTHQIRVHFASIGHPVVGDLLYGPKKQPEWATRLMLHALSLEFAAAEGKVLKIEAEPPEEFTKFAEVARLKGG